MLSGKREGGKKGKKVRKKKKLPTYFSTAAMAGKISKNRPLNEDSTRIATSGSTRRRADWASPSRTKDDGEQRLGDGERRLTGRIPNCFDLERNRRPAITRTEKFLIP